MIVMHHNVNFMALKVSNFLFKLFSINAKKKSLKILGLLTFSLKWNLFYGEQRRRRLHGHTNKSPPKIYKPIERQTHITW